MSVLRRELVYLVLQLLNEEGLSATARMLERESGYFFHMEHFEDMLMEGQWEEAERYLSGFTKLDDNKYSTKIYFEIRKHNFLEALDRNERAKALEILMRDLKVFASHDEDLFKEMTQLLTIGNIRENKALAGYSDALSARSIMLDQLKKLIKVNPAFRGKLKFPEMRSQRLRRIINQGLNWQHLQCVNPQPYPQIRTLFVDHVCEQPQDSLPLLTNDPSSSSSATVPNSAVPNLAVTALSSAGGDAQNLGGVNANAITGGRPALRATARVLWYEPGDLPEDVIRTLDAGFPPTSIGFHPTMKSVLLVGTRIGAIGLWEVHSMDRIFSTYFRVWDISVCSMALKAALARDAQISVNRIAWSPDGALFGVAFSKHLVQLYLYHSTGEVERHVEIEAHAGAVTDIVFSDPAQQLRVITGGEDKLIKVWDAITGANIFSLEGHDAPIHSLCPHSKDGVNFIFSTSVDGNIKAWLYDEVGARVDYNAPGNGPTTLAYSGNDNARLFSCGIGRGGEAFLVEWDEAEGSIKRKYRGLSTDDFDAIHFATVKNKYLAVGDEYTVKFFNMDHEEWVMGTDADGGLPFRPQFRFNYDGSLLAVVARRNIVKILGTDTIQQSQEVLPKDIAQVGNREKIEKNRRLVMSDPQFLDAAKGIPKVDYDSVKELSPIIHDYSRFDALKMYYAYEPSDIVCAQLPPNGLKTETISKLIYTNSGNAILALALDGVHLAWKWQKSALNSAGTANARSSPEIWQPKEKRVMKNLLSETPLDKVIPCFALSKNGSYLISASGGSVSLFNMVTFKTMVTFMPPPPTPTCVAFYPRDNNVIAIGMDDSTVVIYNARLDQIITKLEGHKGRVTGLAFSDALEVLVSSGEDAQIILWEIEGWMRQSTEMLQDPIPNLSSAWFETSIQFHKDQRHFLAANGLTLAIYDAPDLGCVAKWSATDIFPETVFELIPRNNSPIINAVFSCNGQIVYAGFCNGSVAVFQGLSLEKCFEIQQTAYLPEPKSCEVFLSTVAAHSKLPTQFAVGMTDGRVFIIEPPLGPKPWWGPVLKDEEQERSRVKAEENPKLPSESGSGSSYTDDDIDMDTIY